MDFAVFAITAAHAQCMWDACTLYAIMTQGKVMTLLNYALSILCLGFWPLQVRVVQYLRGSWYMVRTRVSVPAAQSLSITSGWEGYASRSREDAGAVPSPGVASTEYETAHAFWAHITNRRDTAEAALSRLSVFRLLQQESAHETHIQDLSRGTAPVRED